MSDPQAKAERSKAKDLRQGVKTQQEHPQRGKKKKIDKPYHVCTIWGFNNSKEKWVYYKAKDLEHAKLLLEKAKRSSIREREFWIELNGEKIDV